MLNWSIQTTTSTGVESSCANGCLRCANEVPRFPQLQGLPLSRSFSARATKGVLTGAVRFGEGHGQWEPYESRGMSWLSCSQGAR